MKKKKIATAKLYQLRDGGGGGSELGIYHRGIQLSKSDELSRKTHNLCAAFNSILAKILILLKCKISTKNDFVVAYFVK